MSYKKKVTQEEPKTKVNKRNIREDLFKVSMDLVKVSKSGKIMIYNTVSVIIESVIIHFTS